MLKSECPNCGNAVPVFASACAACGIPNRARLGALAVTGSLIALVVAIGFVVAVIVPLALITTTQTLQPGWGISFPVNALAIPMGVALITSGLLLVVVTVKLFVTVGQGTLAPWDPTQRLVVVGVYRYVRNPMISGVVQYLAGRGAPVPRPGC